MDYDHKTVITDDANREPIIQSLLGERRDARVTRRTRSCTVRTSRGPSSRTPISGGRTLAPEVAAGILLGRRCDVPNLCQRDAS